MSLYTDTRDEIYNQLTSISGIGQVFLSQKYPTDWQSFFELYRNKYTNKCIVTFVTLNNPITETIGDEETVLTADNFINYVHRSETWRISLIYAFQDDDTNPSEYDFQELCELIEEKFRFLQDLNGKAFRSYPLQTILRAVS